MTGSLILVLLKLIGSTNPILFCTISTNFHTLSEAIFTRDQFASIKVLQAMPVKPRPLRSVRNQFEHPNARPNDSLE